MPVVSTSETVGGVLYVVERDVDTNALLRRIVAARDDQPLKARLRLELEDAIDDLFRVKNFVDYAVAKADVPAAAITEGRALEAALYQRAKDVFVEWRDA
jgi:hypothetical protein